MITNFSTPSEIALELVLWILTAWALRECYVYSSQLYTLWEVGAFGKHRAATANKAPQSPPPHKKPEPPIQGG